MYESEDRMVSHPDHYISETGMEVIDVIEAFTFDLKGIEAADTANIIKYACRWKKKNGIQDLEKILWYTQHLIDHLKKTEKVEEENKIMKKTYKIDVDCANCANKMEDAAKKTAGVKDATVNFMALKMIVEFEEGQDPKAVMPEVLKNCKKVEDDCEIFL